VNPKAGLYAAAFVLFVSFVAFGRHVSRRPLGTLDARAAHLRARGVPVALAFTASGRMKALLALYVAIIISYYLAHLPVWIPIVLACSQGVSQMILEMLKLFFKRVRPDYWIVGLDAGHSYPSGHAATAVTTFCAWALVVAVSAMPPYVKYALVVVLALWAAGVAWSRLALGAHYLSDVIGGLMFGCAWLCALVALLLRTSAVK